jgi:hypothetical protein
MFSIGLVANDQAEVDYSQSVVNTTYHEIIRLHVSVQVKSCVERLQTLKSLGGYLNERKFSFEIRKVQVILYCAIEILNHYVISAIVKTISIKHWYAF